jgi:exosortase A-associated hydrolase 1
MSYVESALTFECGGERLVGVLAEPAAESDVGVVVVVGGPQYRVGSHRQFLLLGRRLAAEGIAVLRFDYRGMGDATGVARSFDDVSPDIGAAIDAFQAACPTIRRIVLWGLCDAASAALIYYETTRDARVAAVVILNPWVRSDATMAKVHLKHYYGRRVLEREFWKKLARGGVGLAGAMRSLIESVAAASMGRRQRNGSGPAAFQDRMARGLEAFDGPVLIVSSENDLTAKEFVEFARSDPNWRRVLARKNVDRQDVCEADHTFSTARWRREVEDRTLAWIQRTVLAKAR